MTPAQEFEGIFLVAPSTPEVRPVMSMPSRVVASKRFISEVIEMLEESGADKTKVADWIADKMERFAASFAKPVIDMDGNGPICSFCSVIWPLCGHHLHSAELEVTT